MKINLEMTQVNEKHPPFYEWLLLDMGKFYCCGMIVDIGPSDYEFEGDTLIEYEQEESPDYADFQFYIKPMFNNWVAVDQTAEDDFLDFYSDLIVSWALLPEKSFFKCYAVKHPYE